jgi:hypothetical protein
VIGWEDIAPLNTLGLRAIWPTWHHFALTLELIVTISAVKCGTKHGGERGVIVSVGNYLNIAIVNLTGRR